MPARTMTASRRLGHPHRLPPAPRAPAIAGAAPAAEDVCEARCIDQDRVERAHAAMPEADTVGALAETFRVLGDPTRLRIVRALMAEELCVCDLGVLLGLSQPTVSHSLRALRQLRLVRYRKVGKIAYYSLDDDHVRQIVDTGFVHVGESVRP